jgi:glutamine synthetase
MLENYSKIINIEALTMIEMTRREILPAIEEFVKDTALTASAKKSVLPDINCEYEEKLVRRLSTICSCADEICAKLETEVPRVRHIKDAILRSEECRDLILPTMNSLRALLDEAETVTSSKYWPFPNYGELLYGIS